MKEFSGLLRILKNLCAYFLTCLQSGSSVPVLIVSLISNYGKHRSRWLLTRLERWVADTYSNSKSLIRVEHLSESNRRLELNHYYNLVRGGSRRSQARTSAKQMGHRRNFRSFEHIKRTLEQEVHRLGPSEPLDQCASYHCKQCTQQPALQADQLSALSTARNRLLFWQAQGREHFGQRRFCVGTFYIVVL